MKAALVIMAAGLGSRYGGNKQVDGVGPNGEILMEYSIYDAIRAGFTKIVFVIKPGMEEMMRRICGGYVARRTALDGSVMEVCYAVQSSPKSRSKPFGTVHAVLCAQPFIKEPFCVINADDYYGVESFKTAYNALFESCSGTESFMIGYTLGETLSSQGAVSRGLCKVKKSKLLGIEETKGIYIDTTGEIRDQVEEVLDPQSTVSMNFFGFNPGVFSILGLYFQEFLRLNSSGQNTECLLPDFIGYCMDTETLSVRVYKSTNHWFGMTYIEDRQKVQKHLKELHDQGVYPKYIRG